VLNADSDGSTYEPKRLMETASPLETKRKQRANEKAIAQGITNFGEV